MNDETPEEKKEAQMYTFTDLVSSLSATRMEYEGISIEEVARAFQEAKWSKEEVGSLIFQLTKRYE